jgi:hypothetical protein
MPQENQLTTAHDESDRRLNDRRRFSLRTLVCSLTKGRRRTLRRGSDRYFGGYVDRYESRLLFSAVGILLLSFTDAALTLTLLRLGAVELNTFMAVLIETDVRVFIAGKTFITLASLLLLVVHYRFRVFRHLRVSYIIYFFLSVYTLLIAYELTLLAMLAL